MFLDNASMSLDGDRDLALEADPDDATFSFTLSGPKAASALLQLLTTSILGMCTPQDWSPICRDVISILSSMGISFSSCELTAGSKKIGIQGTGGLMKLPEDGSTLNRMVSFSPVCIQGGRARC
jgi:hypothetical protein